jgi:hypothetical protein
LVLTTLFIVLLVVNLFIAVFTVILYGNLLSMSAADVRMLTCLLLIKHLLMQLLLEQLSLKLLP